MPATGPIQERSADAFVRVFRAVLRDTRSGACGRRRPRFFLESPCPGEPVEILWLTVTLYYVMLGSMTETFSAETLAEIINEWCEEHGIVPASGQAGERMTVRNIRYYRTLGLLDAPLAGGGQGYGEKHRLQLAAIRLLQAQGLPLGRIQELLFGRSLEELRRIEKQGLAELAANPLPAFRPAPGETWSVLPLNPEFLLISRQGRSLSAELREQLLAVLEPNSIKSARDRTHRA